MGAPQLDARKFYVRAADGREYGPYPTAVVLQYVQEKRIAPNDLVREDSGSEWLPIVQLFAGELGAHAEDDVGEARYYVRRDGKISGPFSAAKIEAGISQKRVRPHDEIRDGHRGPWKMATQLFIFEGGAAADELKPAQQRRKSAVKRVEYASFGSRVAACFLDGIFIFVVLVVVNAASALLGFKGMGGRQLLTVVMTACYYAYFESSPAQATPGKQKLGIRVADMDGRRISFARALARYFAKSLSGLILGFGFLMPLFQRQCQALHDVIVGTVVVKGD